MKKIKLGFKNTKEVLSRDELKSIVGGFASGGSGGSGHPHCEGLDDREVCCEDNGKLGTCDSLLDDGCISVVSKDSDRCPK